MKINIQFLVWFVLGIAAAHDLSGQRTIKASNGQDIVVEFLLQGDSLFKEGKLKESIRAYKIEYSLYPTMAVYGLACAFAKDNQADSAFKYLFEDLKFDSTTYTLTNPDFLELRSDPRWQAVVEKSSGNIVGKARGSIVDLQLALKLWDMSAWDQAYYYEIFIVEANLGKDSPVCTTLWKVKEKINQENQRLLDSIISVKGWPKISQVGSTAASTAFLIIQHSTLEKQQKYLPIIRELCETQEAEWESYALMYDRVQVGQGKPQCYGSQIVFNDSTGKYELYPIIDEKDVDKRRLKIGLSPLSEYVSQWGIEYANK